MFAKQQHLAELMIENERQNMHDIYWDVLIQDLEFFSKCSQKKPEMRTLQMRWI